MAAHLRLALAHNHLLSSTSRAQLDNAALVERLHQQMELTAQASREKSQFLASASHDLRQPLHALSFFGATLEKYVGEQRLVLATTVAKLLPVAATSGTTVGA